MFRKILYMNNLAVELRSIAECIEKGEHITIQEIKKRIHNFMIPINDILPIELLLKIMSYVIKPCVSNTIKKQKKLVLYRPICMAFLGRENYNLYKTCIFGKCPFLLYKNMCESKKLIQNLITSKYKLFFADIFSTRKELTVILWKENETFKMFLESEIGVTRYVSSMMKTTSLLFPDRITFHDATMAYKTRGSSPYDTTILDSITYEDKERTIRFIDALPLCEIKM